MKTKRSDIRYILHVFTLLFLLFHKSAFAQINSPNPVILPQNGSTSLIVEPGQSLTVTSGTSITLKNGVHFKQGSYVLLKIDPNISGPGAPDNPNENSNMNWTLARSFDANGNTIGETKTFFDDNGKALQTQFKNLEAGHVVAIQPLYDVGGKQVGSTLSAPINNVSFNYRADFARRSDGNGLNYQSYGRYANGIHIYDKRFNADPADKSQIGTLGWYYSSNNQWEHLQDVTDYPYSLSTGANNGVSNFSISGGIGAATRLGSGHEVVQFSLPVFGELDLYTSIRNKYFSEGDIGGKILRDSSNSVMSVIIDQDDRIQMRVSIEGKTVMTAREGNDLLIPRAVLVGSGKTNYFGILQEQDVSFTGGILKDYLRGEAQTTLSNGAIRLKPGLYQLSSSSGVISGAFQYSVSDITYTFYDQLGRVKATIPPEGVKKLLNGGIDNYASLAGIPFVETFEYDGKGNVIASVNPDAGRSEFKYSSDGKLRLSQNALQRQTGKFSYTNYDAYGRAIESGELSPTLTTLFTAINQVQLDLTGESSNSILQGVKSDITVSKYDEAEVIPGLSGYTQDTYFLSGSAVSTTARYTTAISDTHLVSKTWYNYDGDGHILWTVNYTPELQYKTVDYSYDDLGNVVKSIYQKNSATETFIHYFEFNKNNQLSAAYTGTTDDPGSKVLQARYYYYLHGPLKRIELADKLQGIDYVYGIDGKLKSINNAQSTKDPGRDGSANGFAKDVFGLNLEYYSGDYMHTDAGISSIQTNGAVSNYNGMVNGISWFSRKPVSISGLDAPVMNTYTYDRNQQLTSSNWGTPDYAANSFTSSGNANREHNLSYDLHGNLRSLQRTNSSGTDLSNFTYNYAANTNKLSSVTGYADYTYDAIGQLASQIKGGAGMYLDYDASGKVSKIYSDAGKSVVMLSFVYDESGNRIRKQDHRTGSVTYYTYDAGGSLMAIYDNAGAGGAIRLAEQPVYAANRIGTYYRQAGNYQYTLTDHLGNTRVVINRNKLSNGEADVVYYADYYPFGMVLRSGGVEGRYGYQGQYAEKDGETGWNNFELRNYDAAIGRWLTVDPYGQYYSPYVGMGNNPVSGVDPDGGWNDGGGLWGWLKGVFSSKEDVAARIVLEEAVVTRVVKSKPAYETFGVRVDHIQQPTLSASKPDPYGTSYSHRQMMYNYSQMLANTNYNDLSNPTTSLAIGQNIANFGVAEIATIKVIGKVGSLYNAFAKGEGSFYRAMSNAEYAALESSGGLSHMAGKELFVSSSASYSRAYLQKSGYDVLVKFNMKPGAMNYFNQVGVMHRTAAGASGWAGRGSLLWKTEQGVMNLGIQSNTHMFNPWINSFKVIK
ncbi:MULTISPECIES: RHS repeat domain-containing protein [unclassified Sphingobacterium]|uniref:RHS repeat domain-containing protein n=1 Tax=unclassified Sphingobacterium TaxID=2609468 RepID=UPI0025F70912|nr:MULTISPECIES: RHS repeat-associated core domain-containing protein [unclassified Sphingobacterium]